MAVVLAAAGALLSAPAADAAATVPSTCVDAFNSHAPYQRVAHVCVNPRSPYIHVQDTYSEGYYATGYWSSETAAGSGPPVQDRCVDDTHTAYGKRCILGRRDGAVLNYLDKVCFRAAALTPSGDVAYLSDRKCVQMNTGR